MNWKNFMKRKKLLSLLLAVVATVAIILVLHATMRTTPLPTSPDTAMTNGAPADSFAQNQLTDDSPVMQGVRETGPGTLLDNDLPPTQIAAKSDVDSHPATNADADADQEVGGTRGTGSDRPLDDFTPLLLAKNAYPKYDYDFQAIDNGGGVSLAPVGKVPGGGVGLAPVGKAPAPETASDSVDNKSLSPSHVPEPTTMLLVGSGLVSLAAFARKLKKR